MQIIRMQCYYIVQNKKNLNNQLKYYVSKYCGRQDRAESNMGKRRLQNTPLTENGAIYMQKQDLLALTLAVGAQPDLEKTSIRQLNVVINHCVGLKLYESIISIVTACYKNVTFIDNQGLFYKNLIDIVALCSRNGNPAVAAKLLGLVDLNLTPDASEKRKEYKIVETGLSLAKVIANQKAHSCNNGDIITLVRRAMEYYKSNPKQTITILSLGFNLANAVARNGDNVTSYKIIKELEEQCKSAQLLPEFIRRLRSTKIRIMTSSRMGHRTTYLRTKTSQEPIRHSDQPESELP